MDFSIADLVPGEFITRFMMFVSEMDIHDILRSYCGKNIDSGLLR
jgi:hypothetical protein